MQVTHFDTACVMEGIDALHLERQIAAHRHLYPARKAGSMNIAGGIAAFTETRYGRKLNHVAGAGMLTPFDSDQMARDLGCVLATLTARPHNVSARNAERAGFHLAYTKPTFVAPLRA